MVALFYKWFFISLLHLLVPFTNTKSTGHHPTAAHPFYISVTEVNHNSKDQTLEISCKMFADDLEKTLEQDYKTSFDISDAKSKATADKLIADYIKKHLSFVVDNKNAVLQYVGYEKDKESAYCYFQIDHIPAVKKLDITNSLLFDFNTGQINIMHVVVNNKRQSTKLDYPDSKVSFRF